MTDIADEVKRITGASGTLSPAQIIDGLETVVLQEKTVTPTSEAQEIIPDTGYYGLSKVTVNGSVVSDDCPAAVTTEFGKIGVIDDYAAPTGKSYYNGELLPDIPADVLAQYPYCWIRKNNNTSYYDLIFSIGPFWRNSYREVHTSDDSYKPHYRIHFSNVDSTTEWPYYTDDQWLAAESGRPVLWSNYDILDGSPTSTDVYFKGTESVQ